MNGNVKRSSTTVRIEMEYADGRVERLVGEAAEAWTEEFHNLLGIALIHPGGIRPSGPKWQEISSSSGPDVRIIGRFCDLPATVSEQYPAHRRPSGAYSHPGGLLLAIEKGRSPDLGVDGSYIAVFANGERVTVVFERMIPVKRFRTEEVLGYMYQFRLGETPSWWPTQAVVGED